MAWNYRQSRRWQTPRIKVRKNGRWVTIGGRFGDKELQGEFNWVNPPRRSTTEYTSDYSSIQDGLNSISSDTELVIDDGPYTESFSIPKTNNITFSGGSNGATINNPGVSTAMIYAEDWSITATSCSSLSEGTTTLSVGNASIFSVGDDVRIHDSSDIYHNIGSSDLRNTWGQYKGEFDVVAAVDTSNDTIEIENGTHQDYPNPSGDLEVGVIDWTLEDFHFHNITVDGGISSPADGASNNLRGVSIDECKNVWITDSTFKNWNKDGISCGENFYFYVDNCTFENMDRYGVSMSDGLTHARVRNCQGDSAGRYMIQCGGGATGQSRISAPTYDIMALNCHSMNNNYMGDAHWGAENIQYVDCSSQNTRTMKIRGLDQHIIGGEYHVIGTAVQSTQIARDSSVEGAYIEGGSRGWTFWPKEGHEFQNLLVKDCRFENMSATIFRFREDENGNPPDISNLQVVNSSWNGEWIDDTMIENSDGSFSSSTIDYSTEYPSDQTPAKYFD